MYRFFLYLHIMGAVIAFGPTFTFPLIGRVMSKERQHANFALRMIEVIHLRLILPMSLTMLVSGAGLMYATKTSLMTPWLLASLTIYGLAFVVSLFIQMPTVSRLIELSAQPISAGPGAAAAPNPELKMLVRRSKRGRHFLTASLFVIVALMVWRPGA
jgi:uncharacterized membrane protein